MYDRVNKYTTKCLLIMDGQINSKRMCRSAFSERDMLSNCVKHKSDAWWLVIFFTSRNERFRQIEIKTWNNYGEENA